MNSVINIPATSISARQVPDDARINILPRHFGKHMMVLENSVYDFMHQLCERYRGNGMDAPAWRGIKCAKVEVLSDHLNQQERPR
jgi:hypothetical protein